jgi:hypothetical protein
MKVWIQWFWRRWKEEFTWLVERAPEFDPLFTGPFLRMGLELNRSRKTWLTDVEYD